MEAELRSCVKVEVAFLGSSSLTVLMVFVDVKQRKNSGMEMLKSENTKKALNEPCLFF